MQLAKCKRIILLDDNLLIKMRLVSINTRVFKLNHSYGAQTLHNSDVFFVCQLLFWLSAGSMVAEGEGDLAGNCSLAANTVFTITSSHLAAVLKLFVVYQPKERKKELDTILYVWFRTTN